ncbi:MAG: hypothetical protein R2784_15130 [Saprospiraceae bacterium]
MLVYRSWRRALGGNVEAIMVGAAPLQAELARLFSAAGLPVREGYGLTGNFARDKSQPLRTGRIPIWNSWNTRPGVEVKIDLPDQDGVGEIKVKGPKCDDGLL